MLHTVPTRNPSHTALFLLCCPMCALRREGVRVPLKVQDIVLQGGDVLLISCHTKWAEQHRHDKAFVLLQVRCLLRLAACCPWGLALPGPCVTTSRRPTSPQPLLEFDH